MTGIRIILLAAAGLFLAASQASGADVARLEWGAFIVTEDSSNGWSETRSLPSDDGRSVTLSLATFEAKAEAEGARDSAAIAGRYELFVPPGERIVSCRVEIEGHVIKSGSTVARLKVRMGQTEQQVDWAQDQAASEKFHRRLVFVLPADSASVTPLDIGIETVVEKQGRDGVVYLSVSKVTITAGPSQVAERK